MKALFLFLMIAFLPLKAFCALDGAPFIPEVDARFNEIEGMKHAYFQYDRAVHGAAENEAIVISPVLIPAGAKIVGMKLYINTLFADSGTGSFKIQCSDSANLMAYRDPTGLSAGDIIETHMTVAATVSGTMIGPLAAAATDYITNTGACYISAMIRGDNGYVPPSAGKLSGVVDYFE